MKRLAILVTTLLLAFALPMEGYAQTDVKVGPRIGIPVGDLSDIGGNLFFGADARIESDALPVVINPSFDYYLMEGDGQTVFTLDGNALYEFAIEEASLTPYVGAGLAITRYSFESGNQFGTVSVSSTDVGLNLVGGARFPLESVEPFVQANFGIGDLDRFGLAGGVLFAF